MTTEYDRYADRFGELDDDEGVTCKRCGEQGLYWQLVTQPDGRSEKPVLFDSADDRPHVCAPNPDDFEVLA